LVVSANSIVAVDMARIHLSRTGSRERCLITCCGTLRCERTG
jgi:hypothetical protein